LKHISYSDVFAIDHDHDDQEPIEPGDLVRTGPNLYPHFSVVAVSGEKAWVRNVQTGVDGITALARCRKVEGSAGAQRLRA
jgi:hypothetical protein